MADYWRSGWSYSTEMTGLAEDIDGVWMVEQLMGHVNRGWMVQRWCAVSGVTCNGKSQWRQLHWRVTTAQDKQQDEHRLLEDRRFNSVD